MQVAARRKNTIENMIALTELSRFSRASLSALAFDSINTRFLAFNASFGLLKVRKFGCGGGRLDGILELADKLDPVGFFIGLVVCSILEAVWKGGTFALASKFTMAHDSLPFPLVMILPETALSWNDNDGVPFLGTCINAEALGKMGPPESFFSPRFWFRCRRPLPRVELFSFGDKAPRWKLPTFESNMVVGEGTEVTKVESLEAEVTSSERLACSSFVVRSCNSESVLME